MNRAARAVIRAVDAINRKGKSAGVRLVRPIGKRPYAIHPKHLVDHPRTTGICRTSRRMTSCWMSAA